MNIDHEHDNLFDSAYTNSFFLLFIWYTSTFWTFWKRICPVSQMTDGQWTPWIICRNVCMFHIGIGSACLKFNICVLWIKTYHLEIIIVPLRTITFNERPILMSCHIQAENNYSVISCKLRGKEDVVNRTLTLT